MTVCCRVILHLQSPHTKIYVQSDVSYHDWTMNLTLVKKLTLQIHSPNHSMTPHFVHTSLYEDFVSVVLFIILTGSLVMYGNYM